MFEGYVPKAKPDPIGIETGCYGERVDQSNLDPSRIYSRDECMARLRKRLAAEYAPKIVNCLPALTAPDRKNEFVALLDTSFNSGPYAICHSPMAASIKANRWPAACAALKTFRVGSVTKRPAKGAMKVRLITSGPDKGKYFNTFRGLVERRAFFSNFCMTAERPAPQIVKADYPACRIIKLPPLLRSPRGKVDYRPFAPFNDKGIS
jgi:GH24 family phage-related lysozyme (muramidase)